MERPEPPQVTPHLPPHERAPAPAPRIDELPRISSQHLLRGAQEVLIEHHGVLYRLRETSLGKLILTK